MKAFRIKPTVRKILMIDVKIDVIGLDYLCEFVVGFSQNPFLDELDLILFRPILIFRKRFRSLDDKVVVLVG